MPVLKIFTNLPRDKIPSNFVNRILPILSKVVRKPEENFVCMVSADCSLTFGGDSTAPGAVANLESIGHLGPSDNKIIAKEVTAFVDKELGIIGDRFLLTFYDLQAHNVAKNGLTIG
ncbi:MIF-like protein mif-2 [Zerene cesonia]|uniref:MIF-like protein mif-2 n=1 Tax=Zerene cesonia TaxID=33412 RepID=UPI0018E57300|nr:MIF-like protein mif-2 [Zerene cesonia]